jgi:hypothetical protein
MRRRVRSARRRILTSVVTGPVQSIRERYDRERAQYPKHRIENVDIYGRPRFIERVTEALSRLKDAYPYGYSLVQRYVHAIEEEDITKTSSLTQQALAALGARSERTTPEGDLPVTPERYAAFLVRLSVNLRRGLLQAPKSNRSELIAQKKEQQAMKLLLDARGF